VKWPGYNSDYTSQTDDSSFVVYRTQKTERVPRATSDIDAEVVVMRNESAILNSGRPARISGSFQRA
jgi:hypothetical protein